VIRGRAEFLQMKLRDNPEALKTASVIIAQIDRVSKLIRSLLNLARGENTKHVSAVRPQEVLAELAELMAHEFRKVGAEFILEVPDSVAVKAEGGPLNQVFMNLLVNSIHAIQSAKETGRTEGHFVRVTVADHGQSWTISFQDTGCGISEENRKKLFQPFFTTKDIGKGTGLGLVTSYRIVESWGGRLEVQSQSGQGAVFLLSLPKA
jgi:signal transduction histidine kinase